MQTTSDTMTTEEKARIKEAFHFLDVNASRISDSGRSFILSLKKQFLKNKTLSEKQKKALFEIKENLN